MTRTGTQPGYAAPLPFTRSHRATIGPALKGIGIGISMLALLVTLGGLVWGMATLVNGKADKAIVNEIRIDVEVIKTEQRMLIKSLRPDLPVGKE